MGFGGKTMPNESDLILHEIEKTRNLYDEMDKYIIVKINHEIEKDIKSFEFMGMIGGGLESIEATFNLTTLNNVMKALLNNNYVLNFEYEAF